MSCREFGCCLYTWISAHHKISVVRVSRLFASVIALYAAGMRCDRSPRVKPQPVLVAADLKARVAAERLQQGLSAQITDMGVLSRLAVRVRQSSSTTTTRVRADVQRDVPGRRSDAAGADPRGGSPTSRPGAVAVPEPAGETAQNASRTTPDLRYMKVIGRQLISAQVRDEAIYFSANPCACILIEAIGSAPREASRGSV